MKRFLIWLLAFSCWSLYAQDNPQITNPQIRNVLNGQYQPAQYLNPGLKKDPHQIACELTRLVSADSLQAQLEILSAFGNRNTFSDTLSSERGIGAARRWLKNEFDQIARLRQNRLLTGYLSFDINNNTCGSLQETKNVMAVLPGAKINNEGFILIMAHFDSRCEGRCDTACAAPGADDNGSGTVLLLELARVMSAYQFDQTLVFMATTGEEQGLLGATAFSDYCAQASIPIKAVFNNDIVGGVICGQTASPPGCSPAGDIDSLRVRLYTNPTARRNGNQGFGRSVDLLFREKLRPNLKVPMNIELVGQEDRSGRGGDHIAFRRNDFLNLRFTSAHEHGNGNPATIGYSDRQHTTEDIVGIDTDGDSEIDSFFVDFNYLRRNALINGVSATFFAYGPRTPEFTVQDVNGQPQVLITNSGGGTEFRLGVKARGTSVFDSIYRFSGNQIIVPNLQAGREYFIALAAVDSAGITGAFSTDERVLASTATPFRAPDQLALAMNCDQLSVDQYAFSRQQMALHLRAPFPNPCKEQTQISLRAYGPEWRNKKLSLVIVDSRGQRVYEQEKRLDSFSTDWLYRPQSGSGLYQVFVEYQGQRISNVQKLLVQ